MISFLAGFGQQSIILKDDWGERSWETDGEGEVRDEKRCSLAAGFSGWTVVSLSRACFFVSLWHHELCYSVVCLAAPSQGFT